MCGVRIELLLLPHRRKRREVGSLMRTLSVSDRPMTRILPLVVLVALTLWPATGSTAAAQQVVPARLQSVAAVDLNENFNRVERYNAFVQAANQWRLSRARNRTKVAINSVATVAFVGLMVTQYTEFTRQLDIGDGSGSEVPGLIAALSIGGALWTGIRWWDAAGDARTDAVNEQANLRAARALLPAVDPQRGAKP